MKIFVFLLLTLTVYSAELIRISGNTTPANLEDLSMKYKQMLLLNSNNVYLIPKECQLERYFGGASQGQLNLVNTLTQTEAIPATQEVFEAKDTAVIKKKIEQEKAVLLVEGKVSKAFLEDKEGRSFGGASEMPLDLSSQQITDKKNPLVNNTEINQCPSCQLLEDGS